MSNSDDNLALVAGAGAGAGVRRTDGTRAHAQHQGGLAMMGGAPKMIIVEDAPLIALDLAETMKDLGFDVRATAFTHDQALAEIEHSVPDYAVIDLHLGTGPDGRDGEALLSMLEARGCRCLVFSGDEDACRRLAELYPQVSVLAKPAQPAALAREMERLRQSSAA